MGPSLTHSLDLRRENYRFSSVIVGIIKSDRAFAKLFTNLYSHLKSIIDLIRIRLKS